jgi:hypothetical protein
MICLKTQKITQNEFLKLEGLDSILAANNQTTPAWFWFIIESREVKDAYENSPAPIHR